MLTLDGSMGEGGGQILRTALTLSLVSGKPFRITHLRAARRRPGLQRQHLACVRAAAAVGLAEVEGASLGSQTLCFAPKGVWPGRYCFDIGTAGSTTLVLQTVLPALLMADGPSQITVTGGTHNPLAPPFEFLDRAYLPLLRRMGAQVEAHLLRPGYAPRGGGEISLHVRPANHLSPLVLEDRGRILNRRATATVAGLPKHIGERELRVVRQHLGWPEDFMLVKEQPPQWGPGNVLSIELAFDGHSEVFTGFGQRGVRAETVAARAVQEVQEYLEAEVAVATHLADQLLLPLALARGGLFTTLAPTLHARTNWEVIRRFLDLRLTMEQLSAKAWRLQLVA